MSLHFFQPISSEDPHCSNKKQAVNRPDYSPYINPFIPPTSGPGPHVSCLLRDIQCRAVVLILLIAKVIVRHACFSNGILTVILR